MTGVKFGITLVAVLVTALLCSWIPQVAAETDPHDWHETVRQLAKERFKIEFLHLEVYEGNPAIRLYERLGFEKYGFQRAFVKDEGKYLGKILMQKYL